MNPYILLIFISIITSCSTNQLLKLDVNLSGVIYNGKTKEFKEIVKGKSSYTLKKNELVIVYYTGELSNENHSSFLSKDNKEIRLKINYCYQIQENNLKRLDFEVGGNIESNIIIPNINSFLRKHVEQFNSESLNKSLIDFDSSKLVDTLNKYYISLTKFEVSRKGEN
jgi:hypothetical protein